VHLPPQQMQGRHPPHEQYISVIPVQGGTHGQMTHQVTSSGGYEYWQQHDVSSPSAQTMSPNAYGHGGAAPPSISREPVSPGSGSRRQRGVRSPNEKSGATRRGGRGRRGGADNQKHPTGGATTSPILEEFRASKSRDWSVIDIKGKPSETQIWQTNDVTY
jgi:hypothetical protein